MTPEQCSEARFLASYNPFKDERGLTYYQADQYQRDVVLSIVPPSLHSRVEEVSLCRILGGAAPHRDHDCQSKINFYLKTGDARTIYFKDPGVDGISYHNDSRRHIFSIKEHRLRRVSEFQAQAGEVFLLDTSQIHCVAMADDAERHMVTISFRADFSDVLKEVTSYEAVLPAELRRH